MAGFFGGLDEFGTGFDDDIFKPTEGGGSEVDPAAVKEPSTLGALGALSKFLIAVKRKPGRKLSTTSTVAGGRLGRPVERQQGQQPGQRNPIADLFSRLQRGRA